MTCPTGKVPFPSPQDAWRAAGHIRRRVRTTARERRYHHTQHAYRCVFCPDWHVSGTPGPRRKPA